MLVLRRGSRIIQNAEMIIKVLILSNIRTKYENNLNLEQYTYVCANRVKLGEKISRNCLNI